MQSFDEDRAGVRHLRAEFNVALARHGTDLDMGFCDAHAGELGHAIQIDDMIRQDETHVEHRHEGLPSRQRLRIIQSRKQVDRLLQCRRIVVAERRRLHLAHILAFAP